VFSRCRLDGDSGTGDIYESDVQVADNSDVYESDGDEHDSSLA